MFTRHTEVENGRDPLTRLLSRRFLPTILSREIALHRRTGQGSFSVVLIDLDQFKEINDQHGHDAGDLVLQHAAALIAASVRPSDFVFRYGGEEFVVVLVESDRDVGEGVARKLCQKLADSHVVLAGGQRVQVTGSFGVTTYNGLADYQLLLKQGLARRLCEGFRGIRQVADTPVRLTVSIGVAVCPQHASDRRGLLQYADAAMYAAKAAGRDGVALFDLREAPKIAERAHVAAALADALERGEFELVDQPRVWMDSGRCEGVEVLLRWRNERFAHVPLPRVIDILESSGLTESVGAWVLDTACAQYHGLCRAHGGPIQVAVNVSVRQLQRQDFAQSLVNTLARHAMPGAHLEVEVTETAFEGAYAGLLEQLNLVRQPGMGVAVDDFGTGFSALS